MSKRINSILASLAAATLMLAGFTTSASAISFGFGVTGGGTHMEATGTETLKKGEGNGNAGATQSATNDGQGMLSSAYGQVIFMEDTFGEGNGFAIGYEHVWGEAKVSGTSANVIDAHAVDTTTQGNNYAEGVISDLNTIFIETPGFTPLGLYLKAGYAEMDVTTNEALDTGGSYGNTTADGVVYGFGFKKAAGGFQVKTEFNYTEWDSISLSNNATVAGGDNITADVENWTAKFGIGYLF